MACALRNRPPTVTVGPSVACYRRVVPAIWYNADREKEMAAVQALGAANIATDVALTGYIVPERDAALAFLGEHPHLLAILDSAPDRVERAFGKKLPLRLRVFRDRDEPSCAELVVEIVTGGSGSEAWAAAEASPRRLCRAAHLPPLPLRRCATSATLRLRIRHVFADGMCGTSSIASRMRS